MKEHVAYVLIITIASLWVNGCDSKSGGSRSATADSQEADLKTFKLADGTEVSCWVSSDNHAGERSWFWCDAQTGPVSYRVSGEGQGSNWKPMAKIRVGDDEKLTITPDTNGKFGAAEVLPSGTYAVAFKIGTAEFSGVRLRVD